MSRQFTDGEISAEIGRIATEGGTLSRTVVRKRLGGGSSGRIDALLKEHLKTGAGASNGAAGRLPADVALPRTASAQADPQAKATKEPPPHRDIPDYTARPFLTARMSGWRPTSAAPAVV